MANLKDTVVSGSLRATDTIYTDTIQFNKISAPSASDSSSYSGGNNNQVLKSNGTSVFWEDLDTGLGLDISSGIIEAKLRDETLLDYDSSPDGTATFTDCNVVQIDNAAKTSIKNAIVGIEPVQDLHGYDGPWPPGGGVNLLDPSQVTTRTSSWDGFTITWDTTTGALNLSGTFNVNTATPNNTLINVPASYKSYNITAFSSSTNFGSIRWDLNNNQAVVVLQNMVQNQTYDITIYPVIYEGDTAPTSYSPYSNVCPISGYTGVSVVRTGKNLVADTIINGQIMSDGSYATKTNRLTNAIADTALSNTFLKAGTYTLSVSGLDYCSLVTKDRNGNFIDNFAAEWHDLPYTFTLTRDAYVLFTVRKDDNSDISSSAYHSQIELGTTATTYEPYQGNTYTALISTDGTYGPADVVTMNRLIEGNPMSSVQVAIEPVQSGSGDPSPSNVRPISGWDSVSVVRTGKNLLPDNFSAYSVSSSYTYLNNVVPKGQTARFTFVDKDTTVDISSVSIGFQVGLDDAVSPSSYRWALQDGIIKSDVSNISADETVCTGVFIYPNTEAAFNAVFARYYIMVELGSTATTYESYRGNTYTKAIPNTVYSGTLDFVSGVLTVDKGITTINSISYVTSSNKARATIDGMKTPSARVICDRFKTVSSSNEIASCYTINNANPFLYFNQPYNGANFSTTDAWSDWFEENPTTVVYELATPITYSFTTQQITELVGTNVLMSPAGQVTIITSMSFNVYGGTLDLVTGELVMDRAMVTLDKNSSYSITKPSTGTGDLNRITANFYETVGKTDGRFVSDKFETKANTSGGFGDHAWQIWGSNSAPRCWISVPSTIDSVEDFKDWLQNDTIQVVCELATPATYQCSPLEIEMLLGKNVVFSDSGNMDLFECYTTTYSLVPDKEGYLTVNIPQDYMISGILSKAYPVGSIYTSITNVNPGGVFGGTWIPFSVGKISMDISSLSSDEALQSDITCYMWQRTT